MGKANLYNARGAALVPNLFNNNGGWNEKSNLQKIDENIRIELMTSRGTQPGNPNMGSDIFRYLKYGKTSATASMIRYEIDRVFEEKFPELSIDRIDVEYEHVTVRIYLYYRIERSNVASNVTLEFINGEGGIE